MIQQHPSRPSPRPPVSSPIRIKAIQRELQRTLRTFDIAEVPTVHLPASGVPASIPPVPPAQPAPPALPMPPVSPPKAKHPGLPVDKQGRLYLKIIAPWEPASHLIRAGVQRFYELTGTYPAEICLSAFHYFTYGLWWRQYTPQGTSMQIPLVYEGEGEICYDILCRSQGLKKEEHTPS